jgi:hypothetical protein
MVDPTTTVGVSMYLLLSSDQNASEAAMPHNEQPGKGVRQITSHNPAQSLHGKHSRQDRMNVM